MAGTYYALLDLAMLTTGAYDGHTAELEEME
jgi:hypothetical protein